MFDDLLGTSEEKPSKYDEEQADAYADSVNERYRRLKNSAARFKFNLGKLVGGQSVSGNIDDLDLEEADELAENIKKAIEQIMRKHGRPDAEIEKEKKRVDDEFEKMRHCSNGECEECDGSVGCFKIDYNYFNDEEMGYC